MRKDRYTPTTAVVRIAYELAVCETNYGDSGGVEFDRWLAEHDLEIVARTLAADATNGYRKVLDTDLKWQGWIDDARWVIRKGKTND
jgi:hypothetical protein